MLVKFTNAAEGLEGNPIYINTEWIVSVYETNKGEEGGSLVTIVFGGPGGIAWEVEESLEEAQKKINSAVGRGGK